MWVAGAVWGAWTLGKIKQLRTYSQLKAPVCSFPNVGSIVPDRNSVRADDEELCQTMTVGWGRSFNEPIKIPGGELVTLLDIASLPSRNGWRRSRRCFCWHRWRRAAAIAATELRTG